MKKSFQLISLSFVVLLIGVGIQLFRSFPIDTQTYIEKKYAGWNGVLQAWICTDWNPGGSFIRWLNSCASEFEKQHDGIYLEFTPVQRAAMHSLETGDLPVPHLIFFSPGVLDNRNLLSNIQTSSKIRADLNNYGEDRALPLALGGYIWAYNPSLCQHPPHTPDEAIDFLLQLDSPGQSYSAALIALLSTDAATPEQPMPEIGIDLGLPVSNASNPLYSGEALDIFIDGGIACTPVASKDIARLARLRENGRGPEWLLAATGEVACTDQILMAGIPIQHCKTEQAMLAETFMQFLLSDDMQAKLSDIGAHSVLGTRIHSDFSVYAELDILINSRPLWVPDCFSEYSIADTEGIVREFLNKRLPAKNALSLIGFEDM